MGEAKNISVPAQVSEKIPSRSSNSYIRIPQGFWLIIGLAVVFGLLSSNPWLTSASIISLSFIVILLWRQGEPPVLFWIVALQWLAVTLRVFYANVTQYPIGDMNGGEEIVRATWLALLALLVLASGMHLPLRGLKGGISNSAITEVAQYSTSKLMIAYLASFAVQLLVTGLIRFVPRLYQIISALLLFKLVIFFLLVFTVMTRREKLSYLIIALLLEILLGFTGFFSTFKEPIFILILTYLTTFYRINIKGSIIVALLAVVIIILSLFWMGIRGEYRNYVNSGTRSQIVTVSKVQSITKVIELSSSLRMENFRRSFESLVERIAYIDMFASVLRYVPSMVPHEGGALWYRVFEHILMPRIFFPDKPSVISPTEITSQYTGLFVASSVIGTSISIGYLAESYIDFGSLGMFIPVFMLGLTWGGIYRYFLSKSKVKVFGFGIATVILFDSFGFGANIIMLVGGILMSTIVMALTMKYIVPIIDRWLRV